MSAYDLGKPIPFPPRSFKGHPYNYQHVSLVYLICLQQSHFNCSLSNKLNSPTNLDSPR